MFARTIPYTFYSTASIPEVGFHPRFRIVTLVFRRCWLRGIEMGEASNWLGYIVATTSFDHLESFPQWLPRFAVKPRYKSCPCLLPTGNLAALIFCLQIPLANRTEMHVRTYILCHAQSAPKTRFCKVKKRRACDTREYIWKGVELELVVPSLISL